jgi:hypothetical protein
MHKDYPMTVMAYNQSMARGRGHDAVGLRNSPGFSQPELEALVKEGWSTRKIATHFGKGQTTIRYWLDKYNLSTSVPSIRSIPYEGDIKEIECSTHGKTQFRWSASEDTYRCQECWKSQNKRARHRAKLEAIEQAGGKCVQCGYNESPRALQFHHTDPRQKDYQPSRIYTMSRKKREEELAKCILLCANCHIALESELSREGADIDSKRSRTRVQRKKDLVDLKGGCCQQCGYKESLDSLQFHHRDPATKLFNVNGSQLTRAWANILAEAEKCDLLCANCHHAEHERLDHENTNIIY